MTEPQNLDQDPGLAELRSKSIVELKAAWVDLKIEENKIQRALELVVQLWQEKEKQELETAKSVAEPEVATETTELPKPKPKRTKSK